MEIRHNLPLNPSRNGDSSLSIRRDTTHLEEDMFDLDLDVLTQQSSEPRQVVTDGAACSGTCASCKYTCGNCKSQQKVC